MPELKNNFLKSKMNKDLDERLVPNGEYRDALGINISQSEGPNVGALEVVQGNELKWSLNPKMRFIGRFNDEINNTIYLFATDHTGAERAGSNSEHKILKSVAGAAPTVLVEGYFLNFSQANIITGISLLENLLFFTDNRNQPRVIDVTQPFGHYTKEAHISVAKFAPYKPISVLFEQEKEATSFSGPSTIGLVDVTDVQVGDLIYNVTQDAEYGHVASIGASSITSDKYLTSPVPPGYSTVKFPAATDIIRLTRSTMTDESETPLWPGDPDYLEDKFVRFSYRFKYENNEYSLVAPWTQPLFVPQQDGFFIENIYDGSGGVTSNPNNEANAYKSTIINFFKNRINQAVLYVPFPSNQPITDYKIKSVEILYKESNSVVQKVVESVNVQDITFSSYKPQENYYAYTYQSKKPFKTLPENVTTRVADKVPVRALSQEIISNRVVYGNFEDRYDPPTMSYTTQSGPRTPEFGNDVAEYPNHTLKQNRNYSLGVVLYDKFGRASTVVLSDIVPTAGEKISSLYHPYKTAEDVGYDGATGIYRIYDWNGDGLRINFQQPITEAPSSNYPGTYAQSTTFTLNTGNTTTITTTAPFTYTIVGADFTAQTPEDSYLRGYHVDYTKILSSNFVGGNTVITTEERIADVYEYTGGYPGLPAGQEPKNSYVINPAGWYSYRIVVQQQEQDYYNVYLPGLTNGFPYNTGYLRVLTGGSTYTLENEVPTTTSGAGVGMTVNILEVDINGSLRKVEIADPGSGYVTGDSIFISGGSGTGNCRLSDVPNTLASQQNKIATAALISDNINKVPRDLSEVGPDQKQYRSSSVKLYLRVNNTNLLSNQLGNNLLFFPERIDHYAAQIGSEKDLLNANDSGFVTSIPFPGYYGGDGNPLIAVVDTDNQSVGVTYQNWEAQNEILPRLAVYETEPVESLLDIYWETSTTGLLSDLNELIATTFTGILSLSPVSVTFTEAIDYTSTPTAITSTFTALDATGGNAYGVTASIFRVVDTNGTGSDVTANGWFTLNQTAVGPPQDEWEIICNKDFTYLNTSGGPSGIDKYVITIETTKGTETTYHDITVDLTNVVPNTPVTTAPTNGAGHIEIFDYDTFVSDITALTNGSNPLSTRIDGLIFDKISEQRISPTTVTTNIFTVDPVTLGATSGESALHVDATQTTAGEIYQMTLRSRDASGSGFGSLSATTTITVEIVSGPILTGTSGVTDDRSSNWSGSTTSRVYTPKAGFKASNGLCYGGGLPGDFTCPVSYGGGSNVSALDSSWTVSNINNSLTDLQAKYISAIFAAGSGYVAGNTYAVTGGTGTGMTVTVNTINGATGIASATITDFGIGYSNGDNVTLTGGGSGGNGIVTLQGSPVTQSNAFVFAMQSITPNAGLTGIGNEYVFEPIANRPAGRQDEILHVFRDGASCTTSAPFSINTDWIPSSGAGDKDKAFGVFSLSGGSTSKTINHAIENIYVESQKNGSINDTIANAGLSTSGDPLIGTIYVNIKIKAYDPVGVVFGTTTSPGSGTGFTYYDNNLVIAERTLGWVASDMNAWWASSLPTTSCEVGLNDRRVSRLFTCGGGTPAYHSLTCP